MFGFRRPPQLHQVLPHQRVFQAVGAVHVPGVAGTTRATTGLMIGQIRTGTGVIGLLGFPGNQAVLDVNFPATGAGAVYAVGGTHDLVVLPALAVAVFPLATDFVGFAMAVGERLALLPEVTQFIDQMTHGLSLRLPDRFSDLRPLCVRKTVKSAWLLPHNPFLPPWG